MGKRVIVEADLVSCWLLDYLVLIKQYFQIIEDAILINAWISARISVY